MMNPKLKASAQPFDQPDFSKPVRRLVYEDMQSGEKREFLLFVCPERMDQYRVTINGKPWKQRIGFTHILSALRKAAGRFTTLPV